MDLPVEVWKIVFDDLDRYTLHTCKSVNRLFRFVIHAFHPEDVQIRLLSSELSAFLVDLQQPSYLQSHLAHMTLKSEADTDPEALKAVLELCRGLTILTFDVSRTFTSLKLLYEHTIHLPKVQEIRIVTDACSVALAKLHLLVNLKYRTTITAIEIKNMTQNKVLHEHGGLAAFIARFPRMCRLKVHGHPHVIEYIHLDQLLHHNKNLQWIELDRLCIHTEAALLTKCPYLSVFHASGANINTSVLQSITCSFGNLNRLHLSFQNVVNNNDMPEEQVSELLGHLSTLHMDNIYIRCNYKNRLYTTK